MRPSLSVVVVVPPPLGQFSTAWLPRSTASMTVLLYELSGGHTTLRELTCPPPPRPSLAGKNPRKFLENSSTQVQQNSS